MHAAIHHAGTVAGVARAVVRKERLEEWLDRELTAILGTDDVALVRMYVLGVLSAEQGQHVMQSVTRVAPVEALQPFLATAAAHFWHELRWADENRPLQQSFSACLCCSRSGLSSETSMHARHVHHAGLLHDTLRYRHYKSHI